MNISKSLVSIRSIMEYEIINGNLPLLEVYNAVRDEWLLRWHAQEQGKMVQTIISPRPTPERIKDVVLGWHNEIIDNTILSGHTWENNVVWLSLENQNNYFRAFVMAVLTNGQTLPMTFKLGTEAAPVLVEFTELSKLQEFILGAFAHIGETLTKGWERKLSINWQEYDEWYE